MESVEAKTSAVKSYGFDVNFADDKILITDPMDGPDGFRLEGPAADAPQLLSETLQHLEAV